MSTPELNSLLGAQWIIGFALFLLAAARIISGLIDPLRDKPQRLLDFVHKFPVRYRLCTSLAILTTAFLLLDLSRLRYHWHVLWMEPNATTWWEFFWRSMWLLSLIWWVGEQYLPALRIRVKDTRGVVQRGDFGP